jgi:fibronectin type 3 domain-containing protein
MQSATGNALRFESDAAAVSYPSATNISGATFTHSQAQTVTFGALTQIASSSITVIAGQIVNLPQLTQSTWTSYTVPAGGVVNAPNLTVFTGSFLNLTGSAQFNCGMLTDITNARFHLFGGNVFSRIAATSYNATGLWNSEVVKVQGAGSRLNMPSVTQVQTGFYDQFYSSWQSYEARDGGIIDWSNVTSLTTPTANGNDYTDLRSYNGSLINLQSLSQIQASAIRIDAQSASVINLQSVTRLKGTNSAMLVSADGVNTVIDLSALCVYENSTLTETNGGNILHNGINQVDFLPTAIFGVRSLPQTGACTGTQCSTTALFSFLPDGRCLEQSGTVRIGTNQIDVDALAVSPSHGLKAFEIQHSSSTGNITGSRLVNLTYNTALATVAGSGSGSILANRVMRAAAFVGDALFAIDSASNELLEIVPATGAIVGTPKPLLLNNVPYNIGERIDLAVGRDGTTIVSEENRIYTLDRQTGALTLLYTDNAPIVGSILPDFSGIAYGANATLAQFNLFQLIVGVTDTITKLTESLNRSILFSSFPGTGVLDALRGDLGSVSTIDTTAPGPVTTLTNPNGDGTYVDLDWTAYNEALNGNDIHHYTVYKSTSNFTNITQVTASGTTAAGVKTFRLGNLQRNQQIYIAVVATDIASNMNPQVTAVATTPVDVIAPSEVSQVQTQVVSASSALLSWQGSASGDVAHYRVYLGGVNVSGNLNAATTTQFLLNNLTPATSYAVRITAVDGTNNESSGVNLTVATYLSNPTGVNASPLSGAASVSWNASQPTSLVSAYKVYAETSNFTSVVGLTPKRTVTSGTLQTNVAGLSNNQLYYVAVTAVSVSGGEQPVVTTVQVTPQADTAGPSLSAPRFNGAAMGPGFVVTGNGNLQITASDPSGMSRVDYFAVVGSARTLIGSSQNSSSSFSVNWNLANFPDGPYTISFEAYDTLNNQSIVTVPVSIQYAPPPAPVITAPTNNTTTAQLSISVQGSAVVGSTVKIYRGSTQLAGPITVGSNGAFGATINLVEQNNAIFAVAEGRGGTSPNSAVVNIIVDQSIPAAPTGLAAQSLEEGEIRISWSPVTGTSAIHYDVYRSNSSFSQTSQGIKVNTAPVTSPNYTDLPSADGQYYYRVVAINASNIAGDPSAQVVANSDRVLPRITSLTYSSTGQTDPTTGAMAPGFVTVTATLSEPLQFAPFFSIAPEGGVPIPVVLVVNAQNALQYQGTFQITPDTKSGTAYAVFSGRDSAGNRGTEINSGQTILIDTDGPSITGLTLTPSSPIQTSSSSPVLVSVLADLDSVPATSPAPALRYLLSGPGRTPVAISNFAQSGSSATQWTASFTLPADAGQNEPENLSFEFVAQDSLGNPAQPIVVINQFQVYQGNLPPLAVPTGLQARARPAGHVELTWNAVAGAYGYQVYRRDPASSSFQPLGAVQLTTSYDDATLTDAEYFYTVASVRQVGTVQSESAQSLSVSVTSDSIPPSAPQNLTLQMVGQGVRADWQEPQGGVGAHGTLRYALYRANLPPNTPINPAVLSPIINNIISIAAIDASPSELEHAYAVVAVDAAGNRSPVSNTEYLNFALLPVSSLEIRKIEGQYPQVTWSYTGAAATRYLLEAMQNQTGLTLSNGPSLTHEDTGYVGGTRRYRVTAYDTNNVASAPRELTLPDVEVLLPAGTLEIKRGVMNRINYTVRNNTAAPLTNMQLRAEVGSHLSTGEVFSLQPYEMQVVPLIVGGHASLASIENLKTTLEITPNPGEVVELESQRQVQVVNSALLVTIETETFTYGATGRARLVLTNTSDVVTEVITAKSNGALPSNEVQFVLTDSESNVHSVASLRQFTGSSVITLSNGDTVARIQPQEVFTSAWVDMPVPTTAPLNARLRVDINNFHYGLSTPQHVVIQGNGTTRDVTLVPAPYSGNITSVLPATSYGAPIDITGSAVATGSSAPMAFAALDLVFVSSGFQRVVPVTTDGTGAFQYQVNPNQFASGAYAVSAVYPASLDRPNQGSFVLHSLTLGQTAFNANIPKNYVAPFQISVTAGPATSATGVSLRYVAADQPSNQLTPGIVVQLPAAQDITAGQSRNFALSFAGQTSAPASGQIVLGLVSNETGQTPMGFVTITYNFSSAASSITFNPPSLVTGATINQTTSETVMIRNTGLAPFLDGQIRLLKADLSPAPNWAYTTAPSQVARIEMNEQIPADLYFSPNSTVADGIYNFVLEVSSATEAPKRMPIAVTVAQSGVGALAVHVSDIYTGTLGQGNQIVQGLSGAFVRLEHASIPTIARQGYTDIYGEILLDNVQSGSYLLRVSAPGHQDVTTNVQVYANTTIPKEVFLLNGLVTVEWSVNEITIEDRYEIILNAVFQTNVPAAVVVLEPAGIQLPTLNMGEIFNGELTLTNYGLIAAQNIQRQLPVSDEKALFEFFGTIPSTLAPQQRVVIPYRITALQNFDPGSNLTGSGGGSSCAYIKRYCVNSESICINGALISSSTCSHWLYTRQCTISGNPPGTITGGIGGGGGGGTYTPGGGNQSNLDCVPGTKCSREAASPVQ